MTRRQRINPNSNMPVEPLPAPSLQQLAHACRGQTQGPAVARFIRAARDQGYSGNAGGWIRNAKGHKVCQGWTMLAQMIDNGQNTTA